MSELMPGGWTEYSSQLTGEAKEVFVTATKGLVGVNYTPLALATQVVNGMNYSFFCNAQAVYPNAPHEGAVVSIHRPPSQPPYITGIHPVSH